MVKFVRQHTNPDDTEQVIISKRDDGSYTYQMRWRVGVEWGPLGPECGLYDTALTAETEAMQRVSWLAVARQ